MRKVKLNLDSLAVDSFTPDSTRGEYAGTVHAYANTRGNGNTCNNFSCQLGCTYDQSCYNPCITG